MAVLLLVTVASIVTASRNEDMPFSIISGINIRNIIACVFWVEGAAENCIASGNTCLVSIPDDCCSGSCLYLSRGVGVCS
ncbi:hypothetical protein V6N13_147770 [Hibiscus sabdariffa]